MMQTKIIPQALITATALLAPLFAQAYLNPYDVLLGKDVLLPAAPRETESVIERQQQTSAERRAQEQAAAYAEQHPEEVAVPEDEGTSHEAAPEDEEPVVVETPDSELSPEFLEMLRTYERVKENQIQAEHAAEVRDQAILLLQENELHSGAPLAPTGAGTVMAGIVMMLAVVYTLYRASRKQFVVEAHS